MMIAKEENMHMNRRSLLKAAGAGAAWAAGAPYVGLARRQNPTQTNEAVLSQAEERIREVPDGRRLP